MGPYYQRYVHTIRVGLCTYVRTLGMHRDRMRSTYYPGGCTKPGTYYQGWFMYMRYTQGQNEKYVCTIQDYVLNLVLTNHA